MSKQYLLSVTIRTLSSERVKSERSNFHVNRRKQGPHPPFLYRGDHAELLQHSQSIEFGPLFHDLAVRDASTVDPEDRHLLAGGLYTLKGARVRAMKGDMGGDFVHFGDLMSMTPTRLSAGRPCKRILIYERHFTVDVRRARDGCSLA